MSVRWVAVAYVLFAGGWGAGLSALPLVSRVGPLLLTVWCAGAFAASYLTCRSATSLPIREATAGALLMAASIAAIHAVFPEVALFTPPAVLGSWAAVAAVVFAASLAGAWLGSRDTRPPNRAAVALLGALILVGVVVVLGLAYAVVAFLVPSFAIGFVFVFALLGAPAIAGVIAVIALGDRSRAAVVGGSVVIAAAVIALVAATGLVEARMSFQSLALASIGVTMTALLMALIGLAGVEIGYRFDLLPRAADKLPRASLER